jgi:hypothetical protein
MSKNKFTSALLFLAIGLNGCAMMQPTAMSGEYTEFEAAPPPPPPPSLTEDTVCMASNGDTLRLSANFDCVANGYTRRTHTPVVAVVPTPVVTLTPAPSSAWGSPWPAAVYGAQTTTGGPVYVHGYTRANGTYVAPHTRRR